MHKLIFAFLLAAMPGTALAQAAYCSAPSQPARPEPELPSDKEPKRVLPIGSYTLAISWSPQFCATAKGPKNSVQCGGRNGKFGFTLHGLWPDGYGKEWPQYCRATDIVPRAVIRQNMCATPSAQLIQHEWAKHGTCMATKPELYFNLSRAFYESLRYPDMGALSRRKNLTAGQFAEAFARANKGMKANMMRVTTTRDNMLSEVWLCMDRALEFARCPAHQGGAADSAYVKIAPGPNILNPRRPVPPPANPTKRPGLILDLDPNTQPLGNSAGE